mgnify:CR=1 FL=1
MATKTVKDDEKTINDVLSELEEAEAEAEAVVVADSAETESIEDIIDSDDETEEERKAREQAERTQEIIEAVRGKSSVIVTDEETGKEYKLSYNRAIVLKMERGGVTLQSAIDEYSSGTLTGTVSFLRDFVMPAFKANDPSVDLDEVVDVWHRVDGKNDLVVILIALYTSTTQSLIEDPTKGGRGKFRLV